MAELLTEHEVDDEVEAGVTHERQVIETGEAEEPVSCCQQVWPALQQVTGQHQLIAVEDDPGDVTEEEHEDDADGNEGAVNLTHNVGPALAVGESKHISIDKVRCSFLKRSTEPTQPPLMTEDNAGGGRT